MSGDEVRKALLGVAFVVALAITVVIAIETCQ